MGLLDRLRPQPAPGTADTIELLQESVRDLFRREDQGWSPVGEQDTAFTRTMLLESAKSGRALAVAHPLVRRGLSLRTAYVHGNGGPQIAAAMADGEQDVNAIVQAWWGSRENQAALTGPEARTRLERSLACDGNIFLVAFTNPATGAVVIRTIPLEEITEIHANRDDRAEVWFYRRTYTRRASSFDPAGETVTVLHPALTYAPTVKPGTVDGIRVLWDQPIRHVRVNDLEGWQWGIGDLHSVGPWARAYRDFLGDWIKLHRSLAQFAWRVTADGKRQRAARQALQAAATTGSTMVQDVGEHLEAIPKTGATIDADSGRPLMGMIAAGLDVPVTMLSTDPGVTGARATAETLDEPMFLAMQARRDVWTAVYIDLAEYALEQAVRAPKGILRGEIVRDPWTRTDRAILDGAEPTITVSWPDLSTTPTKDLVQAIAVADGTGKLPPAQIARLLLVALNVDDIDTVMEELLDDEGQWRDPYARLGAGVVAAFQRGEDPAQVLGQYGRFGTDTAAAEALIRETP